MHDLVRDIRLVAFDLDGTLIDSVPDLAVAVDAALEDQGVAPVGEARVRDWVGNGSWRLVERALEAALERPADQGVLEACHARFLAHYHASPVERTRLYPGVREALEGLIAHGLSLVLITNKPQAFIAPILEHFALNDAFALCLGGDSLDEKKPHPAPLLHAAAHFGLSPEACLMVGDSRHDIEAGKRAGFRTLAVPYGYNHGESVTDSGPDAVVESLSELV
ncbi:phosphoglycolate phosphatase [Halomonas sp. YLGW01]|uniref:phosphoglycolate phosphatase n=1 Tax=Halomonas sp. YLGW01 TaxID=2773308 RepID=UPI00177B0FF2|nr:phosphoglycolate phosphatase [Halomonas sp. YLGW01]